MGWYEDSIKVADHNISALKAAKERFSGEPIKVDILYSSETGIFSRKITVSSIDEMGDLLKMYARNLRSLKKRDYKPLQQKGWKRRKHVKT